MVLGIVLAYSACTCDAWCLQDYMEEDETCVTESDAYGCGTGPECVTLPPETPGGDIYSVVIECESTASDSSWVARVYSGTGCFAEALAVVNTHIGSGCYLGATVDCAAFDTTAAAAPETTAAPIVTTAAVTTTKTTAITASDSAYLVVSSCVFLYGILAYFIV